MEDDNTKMGEIEADRHNQEDNRLRERVVEAIIAGGGVSMIHKATGIPVGTISKYTAKTSTPSFLNAAKIASAAGVSLDEIAFGDAPLMARRPLHAVMARMASLADARSRSRDSSPDSERLAAAVSAVEDGLSGRAVPASVKAELILVAYRLLTEATEENRALVMRLVKGA